MDEEILIEDADEVKDETAQLKEALDECRDKYQRSLAEFDNFRKRTAKEKAAMYDMGVCDTIEKLLPVIDNFERAFDTQADKEDGFYKGIAMIWKQFQGFLGDIDVSPLEAVGYAFDPNIHDAIAHIESDDYGENEVIEEMQKGYKYKEKVIRCAKVKVAN